MTCESKGDLITEEKSNRPVDCRGELKVIDSSEPIIHENELTNEAKRTQMSSQNFKANQPTQVSSRNVRSSDREGATNKLLQSRC